MTQQENVALARTALGDAERYLSRARSNPTDPAYTLAVIGAQHVALHAMLAELTELGHQAGGADVAAVDRMRRELAAGESRELDDAIARVTQPGAARAARAENEPER